MNSNVPARRRGRFLVLLAGVALATAVATGLAGPEPSSSAAHAEDPHAHVHAIGSLESRAVFHDDMRRLWEDHITWTRLAIVTFAHGGAGFDATAARLMQNQQDIGDAVKPFFGDAAGERLTALLTDHIAIAVDLLEAAKAADPTAFETARAAWFANADDIADFLAQANPRYWPRATMRAAMRGHLDQTLAEASHELTGDYAQSVADYDEIHHHILGMADVLSDGIVRAFPTRFH